MLRSERRSEVERSDAASVVRYSILRREGRIRGLDALAGYFRRPPGIALSAVPFVGDDMGRTFCEFKGAVTAFPQAQLSVPSGRDLRMGNSRATRFAHLRSDLF